MKYLVVFIAAFLLISIVYGQSTPSLASVIEQAEKAKPGVDKIKLLNVACYSAYKNGQGRKGIDFGLQAAALTRSLHWTGESNLTTIYLGLCYASIDSERAALHYLLAARVDQVIDRNIKIDLFKEIGNIYRSRQNPAEAIKYFLKVLQLRREENDKGGIARTLNSIGNIYIGTNDQTNALMYWTEALRLKEELADPHDSSLLGIACNIGVIYGLKYKYPESIQFYYKGLRYAEQYGLRENQAAILRELGLLYLNSGNDSLSLVSSYKALALYNSLKDTLSKARVLNGLSLAYRSQGDFPNALTFAFESMKLGEAIGSDEIMFTNFNDITSTYEASSDHRKALDYLFKAKKMLEKSDKNRFLPVILGNIGAVYSSAGQLDSALYFLNKGIQLAKELKVEDNIAVMLDGLAQTYSQKGDHAEALSAAFRSLKMNIDLSSDVMIGKSFQSIGQAYLRMYLDTSRRPLPDSLHRLSKDQQLKRSIDYLQQSLLYLKKVRQLDYMSESYRSLSQAQELVKDFAGAYESYKYFTQYKDSLLNKNTFKKIARAEADFAHYKEIAQKDKERALVEQADRARLRIFIISVIFVFLVSFLIFWFYRRIENNKVKLKMTELRQEVLNAQISDHFIGNTMDSINNFLKKNDTKSASQYLHLFSDLIRKVLENSSERLVPLSDDLSVLRDYIELEKLRFVGGLDYEIKVDESIDADNVLIPPMVFQIVVENAIKHGFKKTSAAHLRIQVARKKDTLECLVKDDGVGQGAVAVVSRTTGRRSSGSSLAQRLIKTMDKNGRQTSYNIEDVGSDPSHSSGTLVRFALPYTLAANE